MTQSRAAGILARMRQQAVMALRTRGKLAFLRSLPEKSRVLDVGCGNNSPRHYKTLRPDIVYTGIDVADYNQLASVEYADTYVLTRPAEFAATIASMRGKEDAVISAHNLEHCDEPDAVLKAMVDSLAPGGRLFLAFPCEESVGFPKRHGTLNFYDDDTHNTVPAWNTVLQTLRAEGLTIEYASKRYRPWALAFAGLLLEPLAFALRRNMPGGVGWALYGFESIIWARRDELGATAP